MHNPCIDLYPVGIIAPHHNPYSHPWIEQRRMRTKLLLGVFQAPSIFTVTHPTNPRFL
jgi:hypothetical protein